MSTGSVRQRRRQPGEQVEQRRLGPLDVVDHDDERPLARLLRRGTA